MHTATALTAIEAVAHQHRGGHRCNHSVWYNDNVGNHIQCPVRIRLQQAADAVRALGQQVHDAAHDPAAVDAVVTAMTSTPPAEMLPSVRESWQYVARYAIEGLAHHLDIDTSPEARRAEAAATLIKERAADLLNPQ